VVSATVSPRSPYKRFFLEHASTIQYHELNLPEYSRLRCISHSSIAALTLISSRQFQVLYLEGCRLEVAMAFPGASRSLQTQG